MIRKRYIQPSIVAAQLEVASIIAASIEQSIYGEDYSGDLGVRENQWNVFDGE